MKTTKCLLVACMILLFNSCYYKANLISPQGINSNIKMKENMDKRGVELIAIIDSTLIIDFKYKLYKVRISDIKKIEFVQNLKLHRQKKVSAFFLTLFNILSCYIFYNESQTNNEIGPVIMTSFFLLDLPITVYYFGIKNPPVSFKDINDNLVRLKPYLRYPNGLSNEQHKILLRYYMQPDFLEFE